MSVSTGAHTIWVYRWEDDGEFNQSPGDVTDDTDKVFGADETMDTSDRSNNPERMFRPFNRQAETIIETQFDGSWSADFVLANTWWLQFFFGQPAVSGTSPATHTYSIDSSQSTSSSPTPPRSAHLIEETHHYDGSVEQTIYTGVAAGSVDISVSVEDTVSITVDGVYADEETYDGNVDTDSPYGEIGDQPSLSYRPMHFGNSTLSMDVDGDDTIETRSLIQDASVSLEGSLELAYELGTRFGVLPQYLQYEPEVDYTQLVTADNSIGERVQMYGATAGTSPASPQESLVDADIDGELVFNANTSTENSMTISLLSAFPSDFSRSNIGDPEAAIEDDITRMAADATVEVTSDEEEPL